ncbi:hypothetical protein, partial [Nonomuraea antimicrobica]|uniref:hypothetical protein n=1 Tax=Nonomuraea antimicrobica TaxID=561173 RepID=UPI0031EAB5DF
PRARRRGRTALIAAAAVVVSLLTVGAQSYDGYLFYEKTTEKETREIVVPFGQAGKTSYNIEFTAAISHTEAPEDTVYGSDGTWLKVDITRKVLDERSATMTAEPQEVRLEDTEGRTWAVQPLPVGDRPFDRLVVGQEYTIEGRVIVPSPVADEVELTFRPSTYRSDTPTEDLLDPEAVKKLEKNVDVLRFTRR